MQNIKKETKMSKKELKTRMLREFFALNRAGIPVPIAIEELVSRYPYTKATLRNYWTKRKEWLSEVFNLQNEEIIMGDLIAEQDMIQAALWNLYERTANDCLKAGILRKLSRINMKNLEIMKSMGITITYEDSGQVARVVSLLLKGLADMPDIQKIVTEKWLALASEMEVQVQAQVNPKSSQFDKRRSQI